MEFVFFMFGLYIFKFLIYILILYYYKKKKIIRKIDSVICYIIFVLIVLLFWLNILIKVVFYRIIEYVYLNLMFMKYSDVN